MPIKSLHADKDHPQEVSSPKMLDIFLGTPSHHLLIYTGIALPERDSQSEVQHPQVQVNLGRPVARDGRPILVTGLIGYTATVGLASIENGDSDFVFATEDVGVTLSGGELFLISNISVMGTPSWLHRFSYQANVIVDVDEPLISGTISWAAVTANVASTASAASMNRIDDLFTITAVVDLPPAEGTFGGATKPVAVGEVTGALLEHPRDFNTGFLGGFSVPYVIRNVPLETPVHVRVSMQPGAFSPNFPYTLGLVQVSGPSTIVLTLDHLKELNVDFELVASGGPH